MSELYIQSLETYMDKKIGVLFAVFTLAFSSAINSVKAQGSDIFFSEYVEGSSYNKAVEIYNPTSQTIDLSEYEINIYHNTSLIPAKIIISGLVDSQNTFVLCHTSVNTILSSYCNIKDGNLDFNGNDVVVLKKAGVILDVIGQVGSDPPGGGWGTALNSTLNHTLVRKCDVIYGDTNPTDIFDPAVEWSGYVTDTFNYLGVHSLCINTPSPTLIPTESPTPSTSPTTEPTNFPTALPTMEPTVTPTPTPTPEPTATISPRPTTSSIPTSTPKNDHHSNHHWVKRFFEKYHKYSHHYDDRRWPSFNRFFRYNRYR